MLVCIGKGGFFNLEKKKTWKILIYVLHIITLKTGILIDLNRIKF